MLCKAAHETQNNVDEKKENQYLPGEKTRNLQWEYNSFWLHMGGNIRIIFVWKGGAMEIVISIYGFGPNTDLKKCIRKIRNAGIC